MTLEQRVADERDDVEQGVRDACEKGPLGFPVVDVAVTLTDGSYHSVDSSELAFRTAGRIAMQEALAAAQPHLLEPVHKVVVVSPTTATSKVSSALASRRGQLLGMGPRDGWSGWDRIEALLPEAELQGLEGELRSLSQGLATYEASFDHLAELNGAEVLDCAVVGPEATTVDVEVGIDLPPSLSVLRWTTAENSICRRRGRSRPCSDFSR